MAHPSTRGDGWYLNQAQKMQVEQIWNTQAEQLQQMALRLVRDPESAEEIVQQVFLSACQKSDQLLACANPSSWLCRTLYCKVLIVFCKRRREKGYITLEAIEQEAAYWMDDLIDLHTLYDGVVPYEDLELLRRAYVENEPFRTIADDMGISLGAAKIRASRTKHRLKQEIRKHF